MAASNESLKIEFNGDLSGLSIVVNGKSLLKANGNHKKERSPKQINAQQDHALISKFASCVNKIPVLQRSWHKSPYKQKQRSLKSRPNLFQEPKLTTPFNKIMAANREVKQDTEYPTKYNLFVPENYHSMPSFKAMLFNDKLIVNIDLIINNTIMEFSPEEQSITGVVIFSPYLSKIKSEIKFEVFPKWQEIKEFIPSELYQLNFPISIEEQEILRKYKNCCLYFTIVTLTPFEKIIRCFNSQGVTSSLKDYPLSPIQFTNVSELPK